MATTPTASRARSHPNADPLTTQLAVRFTAADVAALEAHAAEQERPVAAVVRRLVRAGIEGQQSPGKRRQRARRAA